VATQKTVKLHTMFLRSGCMLPDGLRLEKRSLNHSWISAENITSAALDLAVREAGWHFFWIESASSGLGWSRTEAIATNEATTRALGHSSRKFNAAEVVSIRVSRYLGLRFARVTVRARQIQERSQLTSIAGINPGRGLAR